MMDNNLFWKLTFILKKKYILYWFVIGTINLVLNEFFLTIYDEQHFIITELFSSYFVITGLPILMIYGNTLLIKIGTSFSAGFAIKEGNLNSWISEEIRKIFDSKNYYYWLTAISVNLLATATVIFQELPFDSLVINILWIVAAQPVFFICGWAAYFMVSVMYFQYRLARLNFLIPFLEYFPRIIYRLSKFVYLFTLLILIGYLGLFLSIYYGPSGISLYMLPWLIVLAITPLFSFIWGIQQIHELQLEIKLQHLDLINSEVQSILLNYRSSRKKSSIDSLKNTIDIFFKIKQEKDWPINLQAIVTFILALAAATGQIMIAISSFSSQ